MTEEGKGVLALFIFVLLVLMLTFGGPMLIDFYGYRACLRVATTVEQVKQCGDTE